MMISVVPAYATAEISDEVVPLYTTSVRTVNVVPNIEFKGTQAVCTVQILGNQTTDTITATMTLWQGSQRIGSWNASGAGILRMNRTALVSKNKTYKLTVDYKINGKAQSPVSISKTNR